MPSFTRESGGTLHVAVMGVNRVGKVYSDAKLRDVLQIVTSDVVEVDVFNKADWSEITK